MDGLERVNKEMLNYPFNNSLDLLDMIVFAFIEISPQGAV